MRKVEYVKVDKDVDIYWVLVCYEDEVVQDRSFWERWDAESYADHIAKKHGCEWGSNY